SSAACTWLSSVTSVPTASASPPRSRISLAVASAPLRLRSQAATRSPTAAALIAVALPMPLAAPVTMTTSPRAKPSRTSSGATATSSGPIVASSGAIATVHVEFLAADEAGPVGREEADRLGDIRCGAEPAQRYVAPGHVQGAGVQV